MDEQKGPDIRPGGGVPEPGVTPPQTDPQLPDVNNWFHYHPPHGNQAARYFFLRGNAKELALRILEFSPLSEERTRALSHLRSCLMWANAAIACNELTPVKLK